MSKQLSVLKTLLVRFKGSGDSNFFIRFFITHFQSLEEFIFRFSQGLSIGGEDRGGGFFDKGRCDRDIFGMTDLLGHLGVVGVQLRLTR